jgi:hypothetical protein
MWSDAVECLTCRHLLRLINTDYPGSAPGTRGCDLHKVVLPLYQAKGIILCRDGQHRRSGKTLYEWWPKGYNEMKPRILYSYPNDYDGTLTEVCSVASLPKIP